MMTMSYRSAMDDLLIGKKRDRIPYCVDVIKSGQIGAPGTRRARRWRRAFGNENEVGGGRDRSEAERHCPGVGLGRPYLLENLFLAQRHDARRYVGDTSRGSVCHLSFSSWSSFLSPNHSCISYSRRAWMASEKGQSAACAPVSSRRFPRIRNPSSTFNSFSKPGLMKKNTTRVTFNPGTWLKARA